MSRTFIGKWEDSMADDANWVDSKSWVAIHEAGKSDTLVVSACACGWADDDMRGEYPNLDIERCADKSRDIIDDMAEWFAWSDEYRLRMLKEWRKEYKNAYESRDMQRRIFKAWAG